MNLVVDANILIAILIKYGKSVELLLNFAFEFFVPAFVFEEIEEHKEEISYKTHRTKKEFDEIFAKIKEVVNIYPLEDFEAYLDEAEKICPDSDDVTYFALALKLNCGIWSNDRRLKEQEKIRVYSTEDLIKRFVVNFRI